MQNTEELYRPDVVLIGTGMQSIPYIEEILSADAAGLCRFVGVIDAEGALGAARAIHTMLYLLGPAENVSAVPAYLDAEHLRVEGDSSVEALVIRMHVSERTEATLYVMCGNGAVGQSELRFSYERGEIICGMSSGGELRAVLADGSGYIYGVLPGEDTMRGVRAAVAAADADDQRWDLPCTVKNAIPCKRVLAAIEKLPVSVVPASLLAAFSISSVPGETAEERGLWVLLDACSTRGRLLSELTGEGLDALRSYLRPEYECWLPDDFMDMRAFAAFYEGRPAHRIDEGPTFEERWAALTGAAGKKRGGKRKRK